MELILSHSKRMMWQHCHRKFYWSYIEGLETPTPALALVRGSTGHKAVERWLGHPDEADDIVARVQAVDPMLASGIKEYFHRYATDSIVTLRSSVPFKIHIGTVDDVDIMFVGEIDAIAHYLVNNTDWIVERKFTQQIPSNLVTRFQLDDQVRGYTYAAKVALGYPDVKGAIVDICRHTKYPELVRDFVSIEEWMLVEFVADTLSVAKEILQAQRTLHYPQSPHQCFNFGECVYHKLCLNPDRQQYPEAIGYVRKSSGDAHEESIIARTTKHSADVGSAVCEDQ